MLGIDVRRLVFIVLSWEENDVAFSLQAEDDDFQKKKGEEWFWINRIETLLEKWWVFKNVCLIVKIQARLFRLHGMQDDGGAKESELI